MAGPSSSISLLYFQGTGVSKNYEIGLKWLSLAAEKGSANAQYYLGYSYHYGRFNIVKNTDLAHKWYKKAADSGHRSAIAMLKKLQ